VISLKERVTKAAGNETPSILGIGRITGMGATNVIPEMVEIAGTFRTFDERWRKTAGVLIRETAQEIAAVRGVEINVNIVEGYPVLVNDETLTLRAIDLSKNLLGSERVLELPVRMSSEDFSFFAARYPAFLYRLGITPHGKEMKKLHTSEFDIDESSMVTGTATMAWLTLNLISG
jgi:metal-dependent amidase/aminoacylase/carboxypeptidase family protein